MGSRFFLALPFFLSCSDVGLQLAPPIPDGEGGGTPTDPPTPSPPEAPRPPSPWDDLNPGSLPDEHFAVAWLDITGALDPGDDVDTDEIWQPGPYRWDVVDLRGQSVAQFVPPLPGYGIPGALWPQGAGAFVAQSTTDGTQETAGQALYWRGDAISGETVAILELTWDGGLHLPQRGETLHLVDGMGVMVNGVLPDPVDPSRLYIQTSDNLSFAGPLMGPLLSISTVDPQAETRVWTADQIVDAERILAWSGIPTPWSIRTWVDGERTVFVWGFDTLADGGPDALADEPMTRRRLVTWSPQDGILPDELDLPSNWVGSQLALAPRPEPDDGGPFADALFASGGDCGQSSFDLWDGEASRTIEGAEDLYCLRPYFLLDGAAPTFLYVGSAMVYGWEERVTVSHGGVDVWSWDRIRVGLGERPFAILGLARL